jgi:hypothetical protein
MVMEMVGGQQPPIAHEQESKANRKGKAIMTFNPQE